MRSTKLQIKIFISQFTSPNLDHSHAIPANKNVRTFGPCLSMYSLRMASACPMRICQTSVIRPLSPINNTKWQCQQERQPQQNRIEQWAMEDNGHDGWWWWTMVVTAMSRSSVKGRRGTTMAKKFQQNRQHPMMAAQWCCHLHCWHQAVSPNMLDGFKEWNSNWKTHKFWREFCGEMCESL